MDTYLSRRNYRVILTVIALVTMSLFVSWPVQAQAPSLGTAGNFAVLAGSTVTNTGPSTIRGEVGVSPGTAVVGFPPGAVTGGTIHSNDGVAQQAQSDLTTAYTTLAGLACNTVLTGQDLGGLTLGPGTYCFATSAQLTGTLTLDAQGNPNAQFIFQMGSTLTTASNSVVRVINGGSNCNVFWQVGSSATLGTATTFAGNILALEAITATTGTSVSGRLLARNAAVTLDSNNVAVCAAACTPITLSPASLPSGTVATPYGPVAITATGGTAPYTFSLLSGSLPPGLNLSAAGSLAGTPTSAGSFTFTVRATDANGCFGSRLYTIVINAIAPCPAITLTPTIFPPATAGTPYAPVTITAAGGAGPHVITLTAGALPPGITMLPSGPSSVSFQGTPTRPGSFTFTLEARDPLGCFVSQIYSLLVNCPVIAVAPITVPNGSVGVAYAVAITATGGTTPYTFSALPGTLPPGLSLSSGGSLSGIPTHPGNFTFSITATDANGCAGARIFNLGVGGVGPAGGSTLDSVGLTILILLLAVAGVIVVNRFSV